tara:strand:- start:127 stop:1290 length:1164 start_codon:yes stop_codon:yes gene_type:complete
MKIGIVGGCGHIGLPLSLLIAKNHKTIVIDNSKKNVELVKKRKPPFQEDLINFYLKKKYLHKNLSFCNDLKELKKNTLDAIIIAIGTPVDEWGNPITEDLTQICTKSSKILKKNGILILRSTVTPGFTRNLSKKIKKKIKIFYCPERIAQGKSFTEIFKLPQIVGKTNKKDNIKSLKGIFKQIIPSYLETDATSAELTKLFANFYRYASFAISNQIYTASKNFNSSPNEVISLIKYKYPRSEGISSPGLTAGPCLYKDTQQLVASLNNSFPMGQVSLTINEGMAYEIATETIQRCGNNDIVILGASFKANCDDHRSSLSFKIFKILALRQKNKVFLHDPYVKHPKVINTLKGINLNKVFLVVASPHKFYKNIINNFPKKKIINVWKD